MLHFPGSLDACGFLERHWQKSPLAMQAALKTAAPSLSRNDLAWLAMQEDVESRIVFVEHQENGTRYRVETGPFDETTLQSLPKTNWTLLVHDVEKHLPVMRRWFAHVPFIPDWRIDDLMISFAAPGGGVGPHRDNYDVFLCQGIGVRRWDFSVENIAPDGAASDDLLLLREFRNKDQAEYSAGDVLYLPPGVAHWGVARRACMTYSIGMRAPDLGEIRDTLSMAPAGEKTLYRDPDLQADEARPGFLSPAAVRRLAKQLSVSNSPQLAIAMGKAVTQCKGWLTPDSPCDVAIDQALAAKRSLRVHGMARIAYTGQHGYINGECLTLPAKHTRLLEQICTNRRLSAEKIARLLDSAPAQALLRGLLAAGAFDLSETAGTM